jgi:hypothetical protein
MLTELRETGLLTLHNTEFPVESSQDLEKIIPLAWMYINEGHIQYVHLGVRQGREAFYQLFQMPLEGSFLFQQHKQPPVPQNYTALTETSSILIKEALGLRTLLSRFALKFPDLLMTFQPRAGKLTWRDADTEELATFIWELLRQPQVSLSEILARSPCCNAKTYQVLANLLATRQINVARTTNLNAEITNSIRTADF